MTPLAWVVLAYGMIGLTIFLYFWRVRRLLQQVEAHGRQQDAPAARGSLVPR